jgi:hypothetical protein
LKERKSGDLAKSGLGQREFAAKLRWDQRTISKINNGAKRVSLLELIALGKVLDFDPAAPARYAAKCSPARGRSSSPGAGLMAQEHRKRLCRNTARPVTGGGRGLGAIDLLTGGAAVARTMKIAFSTRRFIMSRARPSGV